MGFSLDKDGLLQGEGVEYLPAADKDSGHFSDGLPDMIVIHYTAGSSLGSAVRTLRDPEVKASAHMVLGRDGSLKQLVPVNRIAWHAGRSHFESRRGINRYALGIELDNAGRLNKIGPEYRSWFGRSYPRQEVFAGVHQNETELSYWHAFSEAQLERAFELCRFLANHLRIKHIVGHEEIAPGRKSDPGPAFPLSKLRQMIFEDRGEDVSDTEDTGLPAEPSTPESLPRGIVMARKLNFRKGPSVTSDRIGEPLREGTELEILEDLSGWLKVRVRQTGWVKKDYISLLQG